MATLTLASDELNDLIVEDGRNLKILSDLDAVVHDVRLQTLQVRGENIYDTRDGVAYFEYIFTPQQSYDDARRSLLEAINRSPDVLGVETLDLTIRGNEFVFVATINTLYGSKTITNEASL